MQEQLLLQAQPYDIYNFQNISNSEESDKDSHNEIHSGLLVDENAPSDNQFSDPVDKRNKKKYYLKNNSQSVEFIFHDFSLYL